MVIGTGNKVLPETDYAGSGISTLSVVRTYNSAASNRLHYDLAAQWSIGTNRALSLDSGANPTVAVAVRPDGKALRFALRNASWLHDADITDTLVELTNGATPTGWRYITSDNTIEEYDAAGLLLRIAARNGLVQQFSYSDGLGGIKYGATPQTNGYLAPACVRPSGFTVPGTADVLLCVTDTQGRQINFSYDVTGHIGKFSNPAGHIYQYAYGANNNLSSVTYPDGKTKTYFYENLTYKNALTGITDENDVRYATYAYDSSGRAYSEQLAGGVGQFELAFGTNSIMVTDPLGAQRTYNFQPVMWGVVKSSGASQPAGSGCAAASNGLTYDFHANVASRTDFNGNVTTYTYDLTPNWYDITRNLEASRTEASGTPLARTTSSQWHGYWRLPVRIAEPKKLTTYSYNGDGGVFCAPTTALIGTQPIGVVCSRTEQATTDANGSQGLVPTVTGSPRTWSYTYDAYGQVLTANGPRTDLSDVTTYTYHPANDASPGRRGNLATLTDALGHVTQVTAYDANGRPLTVIDPNGVTLAFTYTPRGWLQTSSVAGQTTTYNYDNVGQLTGLTRPDGSQVTYDYDPAHRLIAIGDGAGNRVEFTLDALGNVTRTTWSNPDTSTAKSRSATYDALGRLQAAIDTRNAVDYTTTHGYDAKGNPTTVTDPKNQATTTQYDALDRPTRITDALLGLTTLAYDARGQVTQFKAPNNAQTSFTVDGLGNVTAEASADRGGLTAIYDAAGNLLTLADARGITESHTYDALNRPLTVSYPTTGENLTYTWDSFAGCANGVGRLCRITDNGGSTLFSYDVRGNVVSETRSIGGVTLPAVQYTWDGADRISAEITATGKLLVTQRDTDGRIQQLSTAVGANPQINLVANVQTDAAGNIRAQSFGNGVTEARSYAEDGLAVSAAVTEPPGGGEGGSGGIDGDVPTLPEWGAIILGALLLLIGYRRQGTGGAGWPARLVGVLAVLLLLPLLATSPAALANETLSYDANGNIQTRTLSGGTTTYGYDALNRLNSEAGPAKTQSLTYDPNDNRLTDGTGSKTYSPNSDRIVTENGQSFTLDAADNVTQARGLSFVWNQRAAQIKTVSQGGTLLATYAYDYKGRRIRKITTAATPQGAGTTLYVYDLYDRLKGEFDGAGNPQRTYVWRDDAPVAIILHGATETALYLETDHLNTPIAARDQAGKVVWKWESDAFGTTLPNEDPDGDGQKVTINLRFPGQYFDKESGLHYNWNRYYDPRLGRYLSPDPIGLNGGKNLYSYVNGNPLGYADPDGRNPLLGIGVGIVALGAGTGVGYEIVGKIGSLLGLNETVNRAQEQLIPQMNSSLNACLAGSVAACGNLQNQQQQYFGGQCVGQGLNQGANLSNVPSGGMPGKVLGAVNQLRNAR